jgi:hypothetical protein
MELKTFVSQSLTQILDGIRDAQESPGGDNVAAEGYISGEGNLMHGGTSGFFTRVDFDILVLAETKDGQPSVTVGDSQLVSAASSTDRNASRVKFSVHVRLPKGGVVRAGGPTGKHEYEHDPLSYPDS